MLSWIKAFLLSVSLLGSVLALTAAIILYPVTVLALILIVALVAMTIGFKAELFRGED